MFLFQFFKKLLEKAKIKKQLYLAYFLAMSFPVLLIGIFLVLNTRSLLYEHYESQIESENLRVKSTLYDISSTLYNISEEVLNESTLMDILTRDYVNQQEAYIAFDQYRKLDNYRYHAAISNITIYTTNPSIHANYGIVSPVTEGVEETQWYQKAANQLSPFAATYLTVDSWDNEYYELYLIRQIPLINSDDQAVLCLSLNRNYVKNRIQNTSLQTILSIDQDIVFFSTDKAYQDIDFPYEIDNTGKLYEDSIDLDYQGENTMGKISSLQFLGTDNYFYIATINSNAYSSIYNIILTCIVIILIAAIFPFCIILSFTRYFSKRVNSLRYAMQMASSGDYNIEDKFEGDDELSETFSNLTKMVQKIKEKEAQIYQEQLDRQVLINEQQQMEFKMLASQINPHFLYNTLETIRMQAFTTGNREVATSIKLLGKSLHYVLENTGTASTTLKKELDYISTYLAIQKLRFNDRVNYTLQVEETMDLSNYQILPLLLQPIVENAILHGLESVEQNGHIGISVKTIASEYLEITITDNGVGMTEHQLRNLIEQIQNREMTTTDSIGLYNINQRIKLCYGNEHSMKIYSRYGEGTKVILKLPLYCMTDE